MKDSHLFGRVLASESLDSARGRGRSVAFNLWDELQSLREGEAWQAGSDRKTLVRYPDFRVDLVAMKRGTVMPRHSSAGRIEIQCVAGVIRMQTDSGRFDLSAGEVLVLDHGVSHDVEARTDSAFLLTVSLPRAGVPAVLNSGRWVLPPVYSRVAEAASEELPA